MFFIALYEGQTISKAEIVAASSDADLVELVVREMSQRPLLGARANIASSRHRAALQRRTIALRQALDKISD